jgi:hypothetical protein
MTYEAKVGELVPLRTSCYIRNTLLSYSKNSVVGTYKMNIGILHFRWTWSLIPNQRSAVCIQHTSADLHSAAPNCWALFEITLLQTSWNGLLMDQPASRMKIIPQLRGSRGGTAAVPRSPSVQTVGHKHDPPLPEIPRSVCVPFKVMCVTQQHVKWTQYRVFRLLSRQSHLFDINHRRTVLPHSAIDPELFIHWRRQPCEIRHRVVSRRRSTFQRSIA